MVDCSLHTHLLILLLLAREACITSGLSDKFGWIDDTWHDFQTAQVVHIADGTNTPQTTAFFYEEGC
jgi:hypothetical protein